MGFKDLHDQPFDETTIAKLEIFQDYAQAWIPTFVMQHRVKEIHIFDLFAGTGYDKNGIPGSPIRLLAKVQEQKGHLFQKQVKVVVHLNEFEPNKKGQKKYEQLKKCCHDFMDHDKSLANRVTLRYYNENFDTLFPQLLPLIKQYPSLVYLDQNGIKFLSEKYFLELEKTSQTDFLYFVSSSYLWRFGDSKEFRAHVNIDMERVKKQGYDQIHRAVTQELRKKLPGHTRLKLYPFSLKKGKNIYGIIFGASHPRAVDKFLDIGWKRNGENGDANFDIDNEEAKAQLDMFAGQKLSKVERFMQEVERKLLNKEIRDNTELLDFTYGAGHLPKHAADRVKALKKSGKLTYEGRSPLVTYNNVYRYYKRNQYILIE